MSFQKTKIDSNLGKEIREHLIGLGLETPIVESHLNQPNNFKIEKIESLMKEMMTILGLDLQNDSLIETPKRIAKMLVNEHFWGLLEDNFPKCTTVENSMKYDEMVLEKNITVMSNCEHHFVTIDGKATVAYLPKNKVLGLSKLNRIVEYFSRRPQIQERLTSQIYHALSYILETEDVAVLIHAKHYCVASRGVEDPNSYTTTSHLGGAFKTSAQLRNEFLHLAK